MQSSFCWTLINLRSLWAEKSLFVEIIIKSCLLNFLSEIQTHNIAPIVTKKQNNDFIVFAWRASPVFSVINFAQLNIVALRALERRFISFQIIFFPVYSTEVSKKRDYFGISDSKSCVSLHWKTSNDTQPSGGTPPKLKKKKNPNRNRYGSGRKYASDHDFHLKLKRKRNSRQWILWNTTFHNLHECVCVSLTHIRVISWWPMISSLGSCGAYERAQGEALFWLACAFRGRRLAALGAS